ncbi:MAG: 4-hydroxy-3-methylbut-2-enyl diphosphate reductase [Clostridium sp.]|nr:4-hydroxy-3-methylbut-2-enyl diphosphate reductase [Clostridium sp.]
MNIEIDNGSGFCFGVTTAIQKAEEKLAEGERLYCLGDIVHNGTECDRLKEKGLVTIDHNELCGLHDARVLLRAHGEPPRTYRIAEENNVEIIDATCPVVLALQRRIRRQHQENPNAQIVIFGKNGHAEVLGLVGQTDGKAIVIEHYEQLQDAAIDFSRDIYLYSQTTKSLDEYRRIIEYCKSRVADGCTFKSFDTICRQVANRMDNIREFAKKHGLVLFVSGRKSSNGKVLYNECLKVNPNTYLIEGPEEIQDGWLRDISSVGICGATSTPKWLMEQCAEEILKRQ